jgi:hypothetical protein
MWSKKPAARPNRVAAPGGTPKVCGAVSVVGMSDCCEAAKALGRRRLLAAGAPTLPLPDCSTPLQCRCRFEKHPDRRDGDDGRRLSDVTGRNSWASADWYAEPNRRKARERRQDD